MSMKHPIIAVTGSSGAGTTTVKHTFAAIFHRERVNAAIVEGDSFHRYTRNEMKRLIEDAERVGQRGISHFGPEANLFEELENLFRAYGESATGRSRSYIHNEEESARLGLPIGTFTEWEDLPVGTDCLFYEGLHGGVVADKVDVARHVDLLIGVAPAINLEWIQKLHRDTRIRGYSMEAVQDTILRRMHDYVHYIVPQFSLTHINFQRIPIVDTSNPFIARDVPTLDESMVVIRFKDPRGVDFPYLLRMIHESTMSRANSIVIPGGKLDLAMQLILTPLIWKLMERRRQWV
ncbi:MULTISPECIES: phosphoribulokinase [Aromatoleum]|uniref:Phosphoribulokinase n=2 Tax=Aromatoleum TaxID=551759 RepID=A0ABX1NS72_9RHOO|nr:MULTISPECIES: phosphoribulokinase [Aromatoleum]MCK0506919.1 phosphoribulokinase [Aromatoleum anaerobium]NMG14742.1 phosphoribulokinase [Aromatoleum bremense]QTQ30985.1 Phosphoribulokinase [Aromatoleum bremense]